MDKVGIIGAGSWGTALSLVLANNGHSVEIWSIVKEEIDMLKEKHEHVDKLPGVKLPDRVTFTTDLGSVIKNNDILVLAVPSVYTRSTAKSMAPYVKDKQIIVCVAKGIEDETFMTISDVVESEIPKADVIFRLVKKLYILLSKCLSSSTSLIKHMPSDSSLLHQ